MCRTIKFEAQVVCLLEKVCAQDIAVTCSHPTECQLSTCLHSSNEMRTEERTVTVSVVRPLQCPPSVCAEQTCKYSITKQPKLPF